MTTLIKNLKPYYDTDTTVDLLIRDGKIAEVSASVTAPADVTYDGTGLTVMPGFYDLHTHLRNPGLSYKETFESFSRAAAHGGVVFASAMPNTKPVVSDPALARDLMKSIDEIGLTRLHQCLSITENFQGKSIAHLDGDLKGIIAISEDGQDVNDENVMRAAMLKARELGLLVLCHCEDRAVFATDTYAAEDIMTERNVRLAVETGARVHICHISTEKSLRYVLAAKQNGAENITCEVGPHHLLLNTDITNYRVNPPIRKESDRAFLLSEAIQGGIDCIATDHAPHTAEDKKNGSPGMTGMETSFAASYTALCKDGGAPLSRLVELMAYAPARLFGLKAAELKAGENADLVFADTDKEVVFTENDLLSGGKNTPMLGMKLYGSVEGTVLSGRFTYQSETFRNREVK